MSHELNEHTLATRRAVAHGEGALTNIRQALENALRELERCELRYQAATLAEKPGVLNHALTAICPWVTINARLGLAAEAQAALFAIAQQEATP
jgi:hypothetical protein